MDNMEGKEFVKPKVYLAGKITYDWWRNAILADGRADETRTPGVNTSEDDADGYFNMEHEEGRFVMVGPHSVGCDHMCYHEHGGHASAGDCLGSGDAFITRNDVWKACSRQIIKSDIVFAYIEGLDAFGTFSEIGFARGCGLKDKFVSVLFDTAELSEKLWFIGEMADIVSVRGTFSIKSPVVTGTVARGVREEDKAMKYRDIKYAFDRTLDVFCEITYKDYGN